MTRTLVAAVALTALSAQNPAPPPATDCQETATAINRLLGNDARLRDWPQLNRYRQANETLAPPKAGESRVVFMGDSITDIWQQNRFGFFVAGKPYVDRGISGQTTPQMLIRFRPDVIDLKPKVVVILAGTNDLAGNTGPMTNEAIEENLQSMAELARANGIRVVIASIMPVSDYGKTRDGQPSIQTTRRPPASILAVNQWIKKYSEDNGFVYLDYFSAMVDDKGFLKSDISRDGLHPNDKGYEIMKPLAEQAINTAFKKKPKK